MTDQQPAPDTGPPIDPRTWVLVPVKSFAAAKVRLAPALGAPERAALARRLAAGVVAAAAPLPVAVVCDDAEVRRWAESSGADLVVWTPGLGLDGAVEAGIAAVAGHGATTVVVSHADLPLASDLARFDPPPGAPPEVALVPDRHLDGTNVAAVPATSGFRFAYGPGSFARHRAEADRLGLPVRVVWDENLAWDLDVPADLAGLEALMAARASGTAGP